MLPICLLYLSTGVALRDSLCAAESCTCSSDNKCFRSFTKCECPCNSDLEFNYCRSEFPNSRSVLTAVLLSDQSIINCHYF